MTTDLPLLAVIAGPTAVGKTGMAVRVATHFHTHILSADSRQFYREMTIGTAVPTEEERARVPHHFIHHLSMEEPYNVSRFENDALALLSDLFHTHRVVVMTGGSGLYIDAVCRGMDELPDPNPQLRSELKLTLTSGGTRALMEILAGLDPTYAGQVDPANPARLIRAIEVCRLTGMPYSAMRTRRTHPRPFSIRKVGLRLPMAELTRRINLRIDGMMTAGWYDEALALYPRRSLNALNTVGYRELFDHFSGLTTREHALEKIRVNTRRYAKRQMTWFERDPEYAWFGPDETDRIIRHFS